MRMLIAYTLIACGTLTAQQSRRNETTQSTPWLEKLRADLSEVMNPSKKLSIETPLRMAVADDIMAIAEKAHQPPRTLVEEFANNLTSALPQRGWPVRRLMRQLTTDIQKVLESAGTSTVDFHEMVNDAQTVLIGLGVSKPEAQNLASLLRKIGEQVRGPEDMRLRFDD